MGSGSLPDCYEAEPMNLQLDSRDGLREVEGKPREAAKAQARNDKNAARSDPAAFCISRVRRPFRQMPQLPAVDVEIEDLGLRHTLAVDRLG